MNICHTIRWLNQHRFNVCCYSLGFLHSTSAAAAVSANKQIYQMRRSKAKRKVYQQHVPEMNLNSQESNAHKTIKHVGDIYQSNNGDTETALENVHGIHPVYSAIQAKKRVFDSLYMRVSLYKQMTDDTIQYGRGTVFNNNILKEIWSEAQSLSLPIIPVNKGKLDKLVQYGIHQGLVLTASPRHIPTLNVERDILGNDGHSKLWMLVNNVVDPMNMGGLIRTAVYFGVDKILLSTRCSKLSPVVSKASSGAAEFANIEQVGEAARVLTSLKNHGWEIVGTTSDSQGSVSLSKLTSHKNTLVIVGNEGDGIGDEILKLCTSLVRVPAGKDCPQYIDSLNVSVAAGIILNAVSNIRM